MKKKLLILVAAVTLAFTACGASKPASQVLSEWVDSKEVTSYEDSINSQISGMGIRAEFEAEGDDILVFAYTYEEQQDFSQVPEDLLNETFSSQLDALAPTITPLFDTFKKETGLELSAIRMKYINADGTVIYTHDFTK